MFYQLVVGKVVNFPETTDRRFILFALSAAPTLATQSLLLFALQFEKINRVQLKGFYWFNLQKHHSFKLSELEKLSHKRLDMFMIFYLRNLVLH